MIGSSYRLHTAVLFVERLLTCLNEVKSITQENIVDNKRPNIQIDIFWQV